jgi:hypothetical protein
MEEDLATMWKKFTLTEEEEAIDEVPEEEFIDIGNKGSSCLVGRLMTDRPFGKETIKMKLIREWKPTGALVLKALGKNTFLIDFQNSWDKSRVMEGRPWTVERNLFFVLEFDGGTPPMELPFHMATFWMRMFNLPLACMGRATGERLGSHVGEVEEVETNDEGVGWGESLRVRVKINIFKPLLRGRMLKARDKTHWVEFKYEKIHRFCFSCGAICHGETGCPRRNMQKKLGGRTEDGIRHVVEGAFSIWTLEAREETE